MRSAGRAIIFGALILVVAFPAGEGIAHAAGRPLAYPAANQQQGQQGQQGQAQQRAANSKASSNSHRADYQSTSRCRSWTWTWW